MPESETEVTNTETETSSANDSLPSDPNSTTPTDTGFHWGDDAPPEWRGKDANHAVQSYNELLEGVRNYIAQSQPQPQTIQPERSVPSEALNPDDVLTDPVKWQAALDHMIDERVDQRVNTAVAPAYQGTAEAAAALSKSDPELKSLWDKFGSDAERLMSNPQINPVLRASKATWDNAIRAIASQPKNLDTLVAERAAALAASAGNSTERGGSGGGYSDPELSGLDALKETSYGKRLSQRYTDRELLRYIEDSGETIKSFSDKAKDLKITVNPNNNGEWFTSLGNR